MCNQIDKIVIKEHAFFFTLHFVRVGDEPKGSSLPIAKARVIKQVIFIWKNIRK